MTQVMVDDTNPQPVRQAQLELPPEAPSAALARNFVTTMLALWDCDDPDELTVLLTSEIVTNAVRYAQRPIRVDIAVDENRVLIAATDDDPRPPQLMTAPPEASGGRGLFLVDALASRWGVDPHPPGKTVWFELLLDRASRSEGGTGATRPASPRPPRPNPGPGPPSRPAGPRG
jgi:anti-sigma regulatory factor (Ser/Thr protein kinase)